MRSNPLILRVIRILTLGLAIAAFGASPASAVGKYKVLHTFGSPNDGSIPSGPLALDSVGNLYGGTGGGGGSGCDGYGCGIIFELIQNAGGSWSERVLHDFANQSDGADPGGNLVLDMAGNLYGTTNGGGGGKAAVFELSRMSGNWTLNVIYGPYFSDGLVLDALGNLFGFFGHGNLGAGAIGELSPGSQGWTYKQLYSFCSPKGGCSDGVGPDAP